MSLQSEIIQALKNKDGETARKIINTLIDTKPDDEIYTILEKIEKKKNSDYYCTLRDLLNHEAQSLVHNGMEYSLFCIPIIGDILSMPEYNSIDIMNILMNHCLDDEDIILADGLVGPNDLLQDNATYKEILKNMAEQTHDCNGPCYVTLPKANFPEFPAKVEFDITKNNGDSFCYTVDQKDRTPIKNVIGLRFILGAIVRPYKKVNILHDIISKDESSEYVDTGIHAALLGDIYNHSDTILHQKETDALLSELGHFFKINEDLSILPPSIPLKTTMAFSELCAYLIRIRTLMVKAQSRKLVSHIYYSEKEEILNIVYTSGSEIIDFVDINANIYEAEMYTATIEDISELVHHESMDDMPLPNLKDFTEH